MLHFLGDFQEAKQVLLDASEKYKESAEITYRLAGLYFVTQKDDEGFYFLEKSLKIDLGYINTIKELFPTVFSRKEVNNLVQSFISSI